MPSYIRPSTRAVSLIDSLCPIWLPLGPRYVTRAPWSNAATSKEHLVRVESFSKMSAMFLPVSFCTSVPFFLSAFSCAERASREVSCAGVKSSNFRKCFFIQFRHFILTWQRPLIELKFTLSVSIFTCNPDSQIFLTKVEANTSVCENRSICRTLKRNEPWQTQNCWKNSAKRRD